MSQTNAAKSGASRGRYQETLVFKTPGQQFSITPKLLRKVFYQCISGTWTIEVGENSYSIPQGGTGNAMKVGKVIAEATVTCMLNELGPGAPDGQMYIHVEWEGAQAEWQIMVPVIEF